jgi:hypothetical protein
MPRPASDGHVPGALDEIPKAMVVALLRARPVVGMETIIGRFPTTLNSSRTMGSVRVDVTTTRAGKCRMSVETARHAQHGCSRQS